MDFEKMYSDMVKEVYGAVVIKYDHSFIQYICDPASKVCIIQEVYVDPEHRKGYRGLYWTMADDVCAIAKKQGCVKLMGRIESSNPNKDALMGCYFRYGLRHSHNNGIDMWFFKEIL